MLELYIFLRNNYSEDPIVHSFYTLPFLFWKLQKIFSVNKKTLNRINDQNSPTYIISTNTTNKKHNPIPFLSHELTISKLKLFKIKTISKSKIYTIKV